MPADKLFQTLLRSLQTYTEQQDTPRLLSMAASLLTTLTNPLNTTLLASQLLTAPAVWERPDGLRTCMSVMGVFHSAAVAVLKHHVSVREGKEPPLLPNQLPVGGGMKFGEWVRAVVKGADERSHRWKHCMVLGGILLGLSREGDEAMAKPLRTMLEKALVQALNMALVEAREGQELGGHCVALVLNHSFPVLTDLERVQLDYDLLLPVLIQAALFSSEGFQTAYFLGTIDFDVMEVPGSKFNWPAISTSYHQVERLLSRPLVTSMGPLSRLIAHAIEHTRDPWLIQVIMEDIISFTRAVVTQWRQNKFSEVDASEESLYLEKEATEKTLPSLWKALKATLFSTTIILRSIVGRLLGDSALATDGVAPVLVTQTLHALRNLFFISSRLGTASLSQHNFVYLAAIDVLSRYPLQADGFLKAVRPVELGRIPQHPLERTLDLFFLNTAEHFTLALSLQTNEDLLLAAATPYLAQGPANRALLPLFEAAHSVALAVFSAPANAPLAARHLPFYADALFRAFPDNLSPRQFRLAFRTLVRVSSPPGPLAASHPDLPDTLLELVHFRALGAPTVPLPANPESQRQAQQGASDPEPPLSEQAVLVQTLLDALPLLPPGALSEWLGLAADAVRAVADAVMRDACARHFWEVLVAGEMDPERSRVCVNWWTTDGGRERLLFGPGAGQRLESDDADKMMSGALPPKEVKESRL